MMPTPCSELAKTIHDVATGIGADPKIEGIDGVMKVMERDFPELTRSNVVDAIVEVMASRSRKQSDLTKKIAALKNEARRTSEPYQRQQKIRKIDELTKELESGRVKPRERVAPLETKEIERLDYQLSRIRDQRNRVLEDMKPKTVWGRVRGNWNAARAIMTTGEFSFVKRQGGATLMSHPIQTAKAIPESFRAFMSDQYAHKLDSDLVNPDITPLAPLAKKAGVAIIGPDAVISGGENAFVAPWAERLPVLRNFSRAGRVFLNKIRMDTFSTLVETLARNGEATMPEAKAIAKYVNESTGHGSINGLEGSIANLNTVFFSPRYTISRFQYLLGHSLWGGTSRTRSIIAKEYAKTFIGLGVVYALGSAAGATIETDPRSTDFGKLKFGKTRLDPLSGLAQTTTFLSREASGSTKTGSGEIRPLKGPDVPFRGDTRTTVLGRFLRTKLAPIPGAIINVGEGQDAAGNPATVASEAGKMALPLTYMDIYQAMREQNVPEGTALSILSFFGDGLQTYSNKTSTMPPELSALRREMRQAVPRMTRP